METSADVVIKQMLTCRQDTLMERDAAYLNAVNKCIRDYQKLIADATLLLGAKSPFVEECAKIMNAQRDNIIAVANTPNRY